MSCASSVTSSSRSGAPVPATMPLRLSPILMREVDIVSLASPTSPAATSSSPSTRRKPTDSDSRTSPHAAAIAPSSSSTGWILDSSWLTASNASSRA